MINALLFFLEFVDVLLKVQNIWKYEKVVGYMNIKIFGNFSKKMFWQHTTLNYYTFCVLIRVVGPILKWKNINMRENIHMEIKFNGSYKVR
jgi:hypothetical protein